MDSSDKSISECPANSENAGRSRVCEGCPGQSFCRAQGVVDPDQEIIDVRMGAIKHKILVLSGKGGVGKSTVAALLSLALSTHQSSKVGVVDLDICGPSMPKLLNVEKHSVINSQYGWKPLISPHGSVKVMSVGSILESDRNSVIFRGPRKTGLMKRFFKDTFWGKLDYLICDTPPGTSDEHMAVVKLLKNVKPDGAVIVTTPSDVSLATIKKEISFCQKMGLPIIGLIENMNSFICPCCQEETCLFPGEGVEKLSLKHGIPVLGKLPLDPIVTKCCEKGENPFDSHPDSPVIKTVIHISIMITNIVNNVP